MSSILLIAALALAGGPLQAQTPDANEDWPRTYSNGVASLTVYQPQVEGWTDFKAIRGRCAMALSAKLGAAPTYGTFRFEAETLVDADQRLVLLRNIRAFDMRWPSAAASTASEWSQLSKGLMPSSAIVTSLDRVLSSVRAGEVPAREAQVLTEPPTIFSSTSPAVLVILDGEPIYNEVGKTSLSRVMNTNWELYRHELSQRFYLRHELTWLTATVIDGPYTRAAEVPGELASLPAAAKLAPDSATAFKTSYGAAPRVIVVHKPAELIVLNGGPQLLTVQGTQLASVVNTDSDLFYFADDKLYYFLASGRWFRAASLDGPWAFASSSLPADFQRIPPGHPRAHVLAAVPGTREAGDAVLLSTIPRTAEVSRANAKAEVQYVGVPSFEPIPGTKVSYAKNTPSDVLRVGDLYYLCFQGIWFVSTKPSGPWQAADRIPNEIYRIPESSPKYNVTYVRVYSSTPTTVVYGYTPGYYGAYVAGGVVVWGTGYYYPPFVAVGIAAVPVYWGAPYYTYGASAWYNPATGVYARGAAVYGPYGGYGAGAAYNPRTGTYAQGAAVWGPGGSSAAGRTFNPTTGTYSAGYHASNPYGSWGEGVVTNGSNWARGGYQSTARGTIAAGQTSQGGAGVAVSGAGGNSGHLARSGSGDVYAGANGNVYKRENGQWYQNQSGSWNAMDKSQVSAQHQQAAARDRGSFNAQMSDRARSGRPAGGSGSIQRPQFGGRR